MRDMLDRIWRTHGDGDLKPGLHFQKSAYSFYDPEDHEIIMVHDQRCYWILIHEITHALGYWEHSRAFNRKCIALIAQYCRQDEEPLLMMAQMCGLKVL